MCAADPGKDVGWGTDALAVDSCRGDSGGPLLDAATDHVIGVTSWGIGYTCGYGRHLPSVYTRVSAYRDWIETEMNDTHIATLVDASDDAHVLNLLLCIIFCMVYIF